MERLIVVGKSDSVAFNWSIVLSTESVLNYGVFPVEFTTIYDTK